MYHFSLHQHQSLWKCLLEGVLQEYESCLKKQGKAHHVLFSLMKLTQLVREGDTGEDCCTTLYFLVLQVLPIYARYNYIWFNLSQSLHK